MALNIKDPETDRLARRLAELTGESLTCAIRSAIEERIEREQRRRGKSIDREELRSFLDRHLAGRPVLDTRTDEEILGYDEHGLPS